MLQIIFDDAHGCTLINGSDETLSALTLFPQLNTKVTMHITTGITLKDMLDALVASFNGKTNSARLEVLYYGN